MIPPQEKVYEYIIFKASDIKDLIVCEPNQPKIGDLTYDPAILSVNEPPSAESQPLNVNKQDSAEGIF